MMFQLTLEDYLVCQEKDGKYMIIGNPYKFSIFIRAIKEWNAGESVWCNGVLLFCIDGVLFPKYVTTATLNSEIRPLKEKLENLTIEVKLYEMEKGKAFIKMYNTTFPEWDPQWDNESEICNDYRYFISPTILSDFNCHIYAVSNGSQIRILAAELNYIIEESTHNLNDFKISETFITNDELNQIIQELDTFKV